MEAYIKPSDRLIALIAYAIAILGLQHFIFHRSLLPDEHAIWLYSGLFALLISNRLTNPYFTPPLDALINSFGSLVLALSLFLVESLSATDILIVKSLSIFSALILVTSFFPLIGKNYYDVLPRWLLIPDRIVRLLGDGNILFTITIISVVYLFHRDNILETFSILSAWIAINFKPIENTCAFGRWCSEIKEDYQEKRFGKVKSYQIPGLALIEATVELDEAFGKLLLVYDQEGKGKLGIGLGSVGRDGGILIKALLLPLPNILLRSNRKISRSKFLNTAFFVEISQTQKDAIQDAEPSQVIKTLDRFCGIVDQDTSTSILHFEVVREEDLSEGRLVETTIGNKTVLYQVIDGVTKEDVIQQKEKYGYARAKARKIGLWSETDKKFIPVPWLPKINSPVFLAHKEQFTVIKDAVGHFPQTNYHAGINISHAVTHNTAILGILGIGKSCLSIELVERMVAAGIKVICLDLTNQYKTELTALIDATYIDTKATALTQRSPGASNTNRDEGGNRKVFRTALKTELNEFLENNTQNILILNPSEFNVWKQSREKYKEADAVALEPVSPAEVTAYVSDVALSLVQAKGMTDTARLCLVYEEAHSLIPEWNSVAQEGDKYATALTSRAILQGRKFGMGCLLITQRTANVTKTILNQCNTIFAMRTFDDTGKEFLSNYVGGDYASSLASLQPRHAVFFGKASSCENPVLIRLNDREAFLRAFREQDETPR